MKLMLDHLCLLSLDVAESASKKFLNYKIWEAES
jgi:hypothetical protein